MLVSKTAGTSSSNASSAYTSPLVVVVMLVTMAVEVHVLVSFKSLRLHLLLVRLRATLILVQLGSTTALERILSAAGELVESLGRQDGSTVVHGFEMMCLMDGDGGVDNVRLNNLLVNDGLDMLVDVMVDTLTTDDRSGLLGSAGLVGDGCVLVPSGITLKGGSNVAIVAMVELLVLNGNDVVSVLLRKSLFVCDGLDGSMVMMLMNLLINSSGYMLMLVRHDMLLSGGSSNIFLDSGLVLSVVREERGNSVLSFLHCECLLRV